MTKKNEVETNLVPESAFEDAKATPTSDFPPPPSLFSPEHLFWRDEKPAAENYEATGQRLAEIGDIYRASAYAGGLILAVPGANGGTISITKASELGPVIIDRLRVRILKNGKVAGSMISGVHLNAMLRSEAFLQQFRAVDRITAIPHYLANFNLTQPGFNDDGPGNRTLYVADPPRIEVEPTAITQFLDVMAFATPADRVNAVAAALTVQMHDHWAGAKPVILATATKSHAGKDTVIAFATGKSESVALSYQSTDWAFERSFVAAVKTNPDAVVIVVENARLDNRNKVISSGFLERFVTDPRPQLFSTGTGSAVRLRNDFVVAISTNFGTVSEDILNRSLAIHLNPKGNIADRESAIGNPKLQFLPAHADTIAAELRGMVKKWVAAGQPLDNTVRHSFTHWARVIGGILKANGFEGFLANARARLNDG